MNDVMLQKWHDLLHTWAVEPTLVRQTFEDIAGHYAEPSRFYHNLDHVQKMLETVECLGSHARNLNAVKLATWMHDVIYDSKASDNEDRSAEFAERLCERLAIPEGHLVAILDPGTADRQGRTDCGPARRLDTGSYVAGRDGKVDCDMNDHSGFKQSGGG